MKIAEKITAKYPELAKYNEEQQLDMDRPDDDTPIEDLMRCEIVFDVGSKRYHCFTDAINKDEALGQFFHLHPHITYDMVVGFWRCDMASVELCDRVAANAKAFPELARYDEDGHYEIVHNGTADDTQGTYQIIIWVNDCRYYCITTAHSMNDALGIFFREHPNITYNMIEEHDEV